MTDETQQALLTRMALRLELTGDTLEAETDRLEEALTGAEFDLRAYLGYLFDELPEAFYPKLADLAAAYYQRDTAAAQAPGVEQQAVTEGELSQTVHYRSAESYEAQGAATLASLAQYRRVRP